MATRIIQVKGFRRLTIICINAVLLSIDLLEKIIRILVKI